MKPLTLPALDPAAVAETRGSGYPEPFRSRMGERAKRRLGDALRAHEVRRQPGHARAGRAIGAAPLAHAGGRVRLRAGGRGRAGHRRRRAGAVGRDVRRLPGGKQGRAPLRQSQRRRPPSTSRSATGSTATTRSIRTTTSCGARTRTASSPRTRTDDAIERDFARAVPGNRISSRVGLKTPRAAFNMAMRRLRRADGNPDRRRHHGRLPRSPVHRHRGRAAPLRHAARLRADGHRRRRRPRLVRRCTSSRPSSACSASSRVVVCYVKRDEAQGTWVAIAPALDDPHVLVLARCGASSAGSSC